MQEDVLHFYMWNERTADDKSQNDDNSNDNDDNDNNQKGRVWLDLPCYCFPALLLFLILLLAPS